MKLTIRPLSLFLLVTAAAAAKQQFQPRNRVFEATPANKALPVVRPVRPFPPVGRKPPGVATKKLAAPQLLVSKDGASVASLVFNLVKGIVGVGVLSLPAGIAAFGNNPSALLPALAMIVIIGILSANGFRLIGTTCAYTQARSLREAWTKTLGASTSWIPAWSVTLKTFLCCLAISMVLADTFSSLLQSSDRTKVLMTVTTTLLLPLCWMKNLASLAPFSLLGVLGMAYTAFAMTVRYVDGNYALPINKDDAGGELLGHVAKHLRPSFGLQGAASALSPNSLILICMLSTAYMAHFVSFY
jgi:hypothetical protein